MAQIDLGLITGPQGPQGVQGPAGKSILTGDGDPDGGLGNDGDVYIETSGDNTGGLFNKNEGQWVLAITFATDLGSVDDEMSDSSTRPVQNKVITAALATKQNTLTFDDSPTADSSNPVKSGGVYTAIAAKQDAITDTGWVRCDGTSILASYAYVRKIGKVVYFRAWMPNQPGGVVNFTNTTTAHYTPNFRIPEGYRPCHQVEPVPVRCYLSNGGTSVFGSGVIRTDGTWIPCHFAIGSQGAYNPPKIYAIVGGCWATWTVD